MLRTPHAPASRVVVPGYPHHIARRGSRRRQLFLGDGDSWVYLDLIARWRAEREVPVWAWCLMPNHVHLVGVPAPEGGLRAATAEARAEAPT